MEPDRPTEFLRQSKIEDRIDEFVGFDPLVVYAGAGVTQDITGMDWRRCIVSLLETPVPDEDRRWRLLEGQTPLEAASTAAQLYSELYTEPHEMESHETGRVLNDFVRCRMEDRLRVILYGGLEWAGGRLARSIAMFAVRKHSRRRDNTERSARCCIVTPNYDDHIDLFLNQYSGMLGKTARTSIVRWRSPNVVKPRSMFGSHDAIVCHHLHGYIPREGRVYPAVVSEQDYLVSREHTESLLTSLFARSNVLIVGSSLTDMPLLTALHNTRHSGFDRWAIMPLQGAPERNAEQAGRRPGMPSYLPSRNKHFQVETLLPDFYSEVAQLFQELLARLNGCDGYATRCDDWWARWRDQGQRSPGDPYERHRQLRTAVRFIGDALLGIHVEEQLRAELWVRWEPSAGQLLRLWASSAVAITDEHFMDTQSIDTVNGHYAVAALRDGRMLCRDTKKGAWRTHLAEPVWLGELEAAAGVIVLSSMREAESSVLAGRNRVSVKDAMDWLRINAQFLLTC